MPFFAEMRNIFLDPHEKVVADYAQAMQLAHFPDDTAQTCHELATRNYQHVQVLGGKTGYARLLQDPNDPEFKVVIKTFEPTDFDGFDVPTDSSAPQASRREAAAFFIASLLPLTRIPATAVHLLTDTQSKQWGLPVIHDSSHQYPHKVAMVQQYLPHTHTLSQTPHPVTAHISPREIFGLAAFTHLVADPDQLYSHALVVNDQLYKIDSERTLLHSAAFPNLQDLGFPGSYTLTENPSDALPPIATVLNNSGNISDLIDVLRLLIGKPSTQAFEKRLHHLQAAFRDHHPTLEGLRESL